MEELYRFRNVFYDDLCSHKILVSQLEPQSFRGPQYAGNSKLNFVAKQGLRAYPKVPKYIKVNLPL
jgi:hypothetical protein